MAKIDLFGKPLKEKLELAEMKPESNRANLEAPKLEPFFRQDGNRRGQLLGRGR